MQALSHRIYRFDDFELDALKRQLLRRGQPVTLKPRSFDLLLALVENGGRLLTKDDLLNLVWPGQIVEESNLTVHMSALRKALGEHRGERRFVVTEPGRGYRFVADVTEAGTGNEEFSIESHTFSRVFVEEEVVGEPETKSVTNTERTRAGAVGNRASVVTAYEDDSRENQPGVIDTVPEQLVARQGDQVRPRGRTHAGWLAALLGLLFLGGAGFWAYQPRRQNRQAAAPLPPRQITMRRFTTAGGVPYRVVISPDGKSLVYMQRLDGKDSLWLGQIDTNSSVQISQPSHSWYGYPVFAPDGGSIYLTVQNHNYPQWTLLRMPAVGGAATELIRNVHSPVTFSPDGRRLAFLRKDDETNQTSIVIADAADGKRERVLLARRDPERFSSEGLSWSPDGKIIAVAAAKADDRREEILAVSVADGGIDRIGSGDWGDVGNLAWLPGASGLVMAAQEDVLHRGGAQIWLVTYPDGAARKVTSDVSAYQAGSLSVSADGTLVALSAYSNPEIWIAPDADINQARRILQGANPRDEGRHGQAWTPDGRLLYTAYVGESQTIWAIDGDGSNQQQLTSSHSANSVDNQVSVTADGRYMVFHSDRAGSSEIWRANTDGSDLKQLTAGGGNSQPSLSPDGQWVVYASARDGRRALWRISIDGGEATQLTARGLTWPEVSPDGKQIACIDPSTSPRWRLTIIPFAGGEPVKSFAVPQSALLERRLRWTPDGRAIMYRDGFQGLWRQAIDKEGPQPVKGFEEVSVSQFTWSLDGKDLSYTTGKATREIILIENFK